MCQLFITSIDFYCEDDGVWEYTTFIDKSIFRQNFSAFIREVMEGVLLVPLFFLVTAGFELKLDSGVSDAAPSRF